LLIEFAKQIHRKAYWLPQVARWKFKLRGIRELVWFGDRGIGDDLLCTAVLREMYKRGRSDVAMMSSWPELFENLPYPKKVIPFEYGAIHCIEKAGIRTLKPVYGEEVSKEPQKFVFRNQPFIQSMCESVGVEGPVENRPEIRLTEKEKNRYGEFQGSIVVQTSRKNPRYQFANKEWVPGNWKQLGDQLSGMGRLVQVGSADDPEIFGAADLRGKTTIRELASLMANARVFVGLEGFLMHLARAVDLPSVIIYGGWIAPNQSGYENNINLFTALPCSPCGFTNHCDYDRECMKKITPETVAEAAQKILNR